jgi:hypothetical protein
MLVSHFYFTNSLLTIRLQWSNAIKIVTLDKNVYGIDGCLGCLDVMKIHWAACLAAWRGQFEGKDGCLTIGFEAMANDTLWIWHSALDLLAH